MVDRRFDPAAGDVTQETCDPTETQLIYSLDLPLGSWACDPTLGSTLHELRRTVATPGIERAVEDRVRQAVQWMLDASLLVEVAVSAARTTRTRVDYVIKASTAAGRRLELPRWIVIGEG